MIFFSNRSPQIKAPTRVFFFTRVYHQRYGPWFFPAKSRKARYQPCQVVIGLSLQREEKSRLRLDLQFLFVFSLWVAPDATSRLTLHV